MADKKTIHKSVSRRSHLVLKSHNLDPLSPSVSKSTLEIKENWKSNTEPTSSRKLPISKLQAEPALSDKEAKTKKKHKKKGKAHKGRRLWEKFEDDAVEQLVNEHGTKKWSLIAEQLDVAYGIKNRNGKQCRERWHNHLDPDVKKLPLSDEEERIIFAKHKEYGNKWAEIAKFLKGRTDNVIKNYFYATLRRQLRKILKKLKGKLHKPPEEVTLQYISKIMKENNVSYAELDNKNIRAVLEDMNGDPKLDATEEKPSKKDTISHRYSLYEVNLIK